MSDTDLRVYVVTKGEYCGMTDQAHLYGVFSTEAGAKAVAAAVDGEVSIVELDEVTEIQLV